MTTSLLLGSDGANSHARKLMGITRRTGWRYNQQAIVCSVQFGEMEFSSTAYQRFLPNGPLALLPCFDNFGSVVWSTTPGQAEALLSMDDEMFVRELRRHLSSELSSTLGAASMLGNLQAADPGVPSIERLVGRRASFPLQVAQSYPYVKNRFALVGDAAHTTHPLAGQGFNLALGDVAALLGRVEQAVQSGEDVGSHAVLNDYQRDRLARNTFSLAGIDALQKIFSVNFEPFVIARGLGMVAVDKIAPLKGFLSKFAAGK